MASIEPSPNLDVIVPLLADEDSRMRPLGVLVRETAALPVGPVDPVPASTVLSGNGVLRTTNLGLLLVQANHQASASSILAPVDTEESRAAHAQYTQKIVASAPRSQPHADIWYQAIDGCKQGSNTITINGTSLTQPSLASMNTDGHIVEASLTSGLAAFSGNSLTVKSRPAPAMLQTSISDALTSQSSPVTVPPSLSNLAIHDDPKSFTPQGFVLAGGINLFGTISAQMYTFHGTATSGMDDLVIVTGGQANESGTISVGMIVPDLKGTAIDDVLFKKTHLAYYAKPSPIDGRVGTWLEADLVLTGSLRTIADDIHHFFDIEDPTVHIESNLSLTRIWNETLRLPTFNLHISHLGLDYKLNDAIIFNSARINISVQSSSGNSNTYSPRIWTASFTGDLNFTLPGAIAPMIMDFSIEKYRDTFDLLLSMKNGSWQNAFGVHGLTISSMQFRGSYNRIQNEKNQISFDLSADLDIGGTVLDASGFYYGAKAWGFVVALSTFSWDSLCFLYDRLFPGTERQPFNHHEEITVSDLAMSFSAGEETFTVSGAFKIYHFESSNATISLSPNGISITAELNDMNLDSVEIKNPSLDIFIGKNVGTSSTLQGGTSTRFHVTGDVKTINGLELAVVVYFDKDSTGLLWTVYGRFEKSYTLRSLSSKVTGEMDFPLDNLAFVASNSSFPVASLPVDFQYPVEKGIQICATLGSISWLNKALRSNQSNLMLQARYNQRDLNLEIRLDSPLSKLSFASNIRSGSLKVGIDLQKGISPVIYIETDISIIVAHQSHPLDFVLRLDVSATSAQGSAQLKSDWINPLGISERLTVSQVLLQVGITYISDIYPSKLGFGGHIEIGDTGGKVAIEITADPREGLLVVELDDGKSLDLVDLVKFANTILGADYIPRPPMGLLVFEEFKLDMSTGIMFGGTYYPAGLIYVSQIELFGKKLRLDCEINKPTRSIIAKGSVDDFSLGPLVVSASKRRSETLLSAKTQGSSGPSVDIAFGQINQHIVIDGEVKIGTISDVAITVFIELGSTPRFYFNADLDFMDHLQFTLEAEANGNVSHIRKGAADLDFALRAEFKQDIIKQIVAQLNTMLLAAKHSVDEGLDEANATLGKAEEAFKQGISHAQNDLNNKKAIWDAKNAREQEAANKKATEITEKGANLQKDVDYAKQALENFIKGLEQDVTNAGQRLSTEITNAEKQMGKEQAAWDAKVDGAKKHLVDANIAMARDFGHADSTIESAEQRVRAAQNDLAGISSQIAREQAAYNSASFFAKAGKKVLIAGLEVQRDIKTTACRVAESVLGAAKAIVDTVGYKTAQKLIDDASGALEVVQKDADAALREATQKLNIVRTNEHRLCEVAQKKLENARNSCDQLQAWTTAKAALAAFVATETALYHIANAGVLALESCAEKIAYDAATAALKIALANTHDIDLAKHAVTTVRDGADAFISVGEYMVNAAGDFVDIQSVSISGSLRGLTDEHASQPLDARVELIFLGKHHAPEVKFKPGAAGDFVKEIFSECWSAVKKAI